MIKKIIPVLILFSFVVKPELPTDIGVAKVTEDKIADLLNKVLSDEFLIYTKTLNFHWNVTGPTFDSMHSFFKKQYEDLSSNIDLFAERIRALGERPKSTLTEFVSLSSIKENPGVYPKAIEMVSELLSDHESLIKDLRNIASKVTSMKDDVTANFILGIIEKHEKMAWMLRSFLE